MPLYSQPTKVVIDNKTVTTTAPGVLVGEVFIRLVVQQSCGDKSLHQPHTRALLVSPDSGVAGNNPEPTNICGVAGPDSSSSDLLFARRLAAMLCSPRPLTFSRVLLCETEEAEYVLANEASRRARADNRAKGGATRITREYKKKGDGEEEKGVEEEEEEDEEKTKRKRKRKMRRPRQTVKK